jgi:hypothetical protein
MNQDRNRDQDLPNRQSHMEKAEGSRESIERGGGAEGERNRTDSESRTSNSGGISNRPLDRERCEQEQVPERGQSQSESER